jgi:hypothetical protein
LVRFYWRFQQRLAAAYQEMGDNQKSIETYEDMVKNDASPQNYFLDELEGDFNMICDLPELFPQTALPSNYDFIGPLYYTGLESEDEIIDFLGDHHPNILVNMPEPILEIVRLPYPVPYYAQVASLELAEAIFNQGMDPAQDPRWAESGADTPQEYAYWVERACGVACLKMCVEALGGPVRSLVDWGRWG